MGHRFAELAFTPAVQALQERDGSRRSYARMEGGDDNHHLLGERETAFIAARDSFYMSTVGESGWPYVQHRGGPAGFVRAIDERTLAFADFRGNRQFVTTGNLAGNDRVALIFMDYPNKARLKVLGHVRLSEDPEVLAALTVPGYAASVQRAFLIDIAAFDWNCPQHITQRFTADDVATAVGRLQGRIAELEAEVAALRQAGGVGAIS
ncbi:MAG: pyridoxamine 5'-phosphate oxidase family protein [Pseudomonadota bacterium]|nr:pyridoxamine 5'-phosphate oxidase family protein [Pseudomonadota bacterium]